MESSTQPGNPGPAGAMPVIAVCGLAFEAEIAAAPDTLALCATGRAALEKLFAHEAPACRGIISFGTGGALAPGLSAGACVIADAVVTPARRYPTDPRWRRALSSCLPQALQGTVAGVDEPVSDAAAKTRLWRSSGACIADMESHWAAQIAQRHGVPFAACRVVADPAHRSLPRSAIAALRDDGMIAMTPLLRTLASRPGELPALIRLAADVFAARRSLRVIRLRAGPAFAMP